MPTLSRACPKGRVAQSLSESFRMKTQAPVHFIHDLVRLAALAISFQALRPCLAQTAATYHDRADQALQSFLIKFWDGGRQYLKRRYPDDGSLTGYGGGLPRKRWLLEHEGVVLSSATSGVNRDRRYPAPRLKASTWDRTSAAGSSAITMTSVG